MIKQVELGYSGMNQDLSKSKAQGTKYFSATNIRIVATDKQSTFAITNEKGNELKFQIPAVTIDVLKTRIQYNNVDDPNGAPQSLLKLLPYTRTGAAPGNELENNLAPGGVNVTSGDQVIIGTVDTRNGAIIATTDDNGFDCIWELKGMDTGILSLELLYLNNLGFSTDRLIQLLYNYENSIIEKVYLADGEHQMRYINIHQSIDNGDLRNLIDNVSSSLDIVSKFDLSQPVITSVTGGGGHTAGMIQYAYNLYILNGAQTTISPISELEPLDKGDGLGGGAVNEEVGRTVIVGVDDIDTDFTHIKLYSIKYTSFNQVPEISLVADREIDNFDSFSYYDDGTVISPVSLAEFLFLGSAPIIPSHIEAKDSRLFAMNIKDKPFDLEIDMRAFSYRADGVSKIWENIQVVNGALVGDILTVPASFDVPQSHDSVNRDYETYQFTQTNGQFGAEGKYIKVIFDQSTLPDNEAVDKKFLKDREIYRYAIEFFNDLGQSSTPFWMCDLRTPTGNLAKNYNKLRVEFKPAFTTWLNTQAFGENQKPVGYRILRAERTLADKTILTQGMLNPMVVNYKHDRKEGSGNHQYKNSASKMPSMTRIFEDINPMRAMANGKELSENASGNWTYSRESETITSCSSDDFRAQTWQFNRLMQMFTPDLLFSSLEIDSSYKLEVIGMAKESLTANWASETSPSSLVNNAEAKFFDGINASSPGVTIESILSDPNFLMDNSFFGPTNDDKSINIAQVYREFLHSHINNTGRRDYEVYGSPEITERGADFKAYNGDFQLRYGNHLKAMLQDDWRRCSDVNNDSEQQVYGSNALGAKCITFAEGPDESSYPIGNRKRLEQMKALSNIAENRGILIGEFKKDKNTWYLGNIYGGNSYEAKSVSAYIEIGKYSDIDVTSLTIDSPGDTFVQPFTFTKLSKGDEQPGDRRLNQTTEIVTYLTESTIDLKNRNDISIFNWDNRYQPRYEEFQDYNRVYSQEATLVKNTDPGFKFKKVKEFDTRIISTKVKIPGESIDSWTDFLENETMDLDGKYGPINGSINWKDEIYAFQDTGVAHISINPRVQTSGSDGVAVQLGVGGVLHDYQYITTESGTLNKWSIIATENAFYYFDLLNQSIVRFNGKLSGLTDEEGFHHYFVNNTKYDQLITDNAVKRQGISTGYNPVNNDVYFSFKQDEFNRPVIGLINSLHPDWSNNFTICFNEATDSFTSFYSYIPSWYINKGSRMLTCGNLNKKLWEHFTGDTNSFYGVKKESAITFNVAPNGSGNYTFNNLAYYMEMTDSNGNDLRDDTFTRIRAYNEYQDSGLKPLILRSNIKRRFRKWSLNIPRNANTRDRIKSPWMFLELRLANTDGKRMVAHDLKVSYTEY